MRKGELWLLVTKGCSVGALGICPNVPRERCGASLTSPGDTVNVPRDHWKCPKPRLAKRSYLALQFSKDLYPDLWTYSPLFSPRECPTLSGFASSYEESKIVSNIYSRGYE